MPYPASTGTLTNVSASATSVTLLAANSNRLGAIVYNDSSASMYLKYGTTASSTSFTDFVPPGARWAMPTGELYTGRIDAIWSSATGTARVTELT